MKKLKYFAFALTALLATSCMDGGYDDVDITKDPYGNNALQETNVISIADLKAMYSGVLSGTKGQFVDVDVQIKGAVTSNDISGNIYNEITIQDETGAICIEIEHGGLCGIFSEGSEILVNLKGLFIGCYRDQAQIGAPYTNKDNETYPSRMPFAQWLKAYKSTGKTVKIEPVVFGDGDKGSFTWTPADAGKLGIVKNITLDNYFSWYNETAHEGKIAENSTFADATNGYNYSWYSKELGENFQLYNSGYSDFAGKKLPHGKITVKGICKNYKGKCELLLRNIDDLEELNDKK